MGRVLNEDLGFRRYIDRVNHFPVLDREAELLLARQLQQTHDPALAEELVNANLRFVVQIAMKYRGYRIAVADLVEEGNLGLLVAVQRFDPLRGLRFMTYASYWIRAYILAHVLKQSTLVGIGSGPLQSKMFFRLARERARITSELGDEATSAEIERQLAKTFRTTIERVRELGSRIEAKDVSLDAPLFTDSISTRHDKLSADHGDLESSVAVHERDTEVRRRLEVVMHTLAPRERYIVEHRLLTDEEDSLADIGRHLHLSRERVRQLEVRIKTKLRHALQGLQPELAN